MYSVDQSNIIKSVSENLKQVKNLKKQEPELIRNQNNKYLVTSVTFFITTKISCNQHITR